MFHCLNDIVSSCMQNNSGQYREVKIIQTEDITSLSKLTDETHYADLLNHFNIQFISFTYELLAENVLLLYDLFRSFLDQNSNR